MFSQTVERVPTVDLSTNFVFIDRQSIFNNYFDEMMKLPYWVFDTETTGTDFIRDRVIMMQLGNRKRQFVIDAREVETRRLFERLEDPRFIKVLQYAEFDYTMMYGTYKIKMEGMKDTYIAEQLITCGLQHSGYGMEDQALKYLNANLDKEMRTSFIGHTGPFSRRQQKYGALDAIVPDYIIEKQLAIMQREDLMQVFEIECNAIPSFGDMYIHGMSLDVDAWMKNVEDESVKLQEARTKFLETVEPHVGKDMLGHPAINPNSPQQILKLFEKLYPGQMVDRDGKPGTGAEILEKVAEKNNNPPEVMALLDIRGHEKLIGTYGYSYIEKIDSITGRFHPRIDQIGSETGRPAGKKPNMLNIPAEDRYRHPWKAKKGRKILTNDYGACELRIMASMSGDPVMCKGFNEGLDYHTFTASQFITDPNEFLTEFIPGKEIGKGKYGKLILDANGNKQPNPNYGKLVKYEEVTKLQRDVAKTINFGLAYGMGAAKLAHKLRIPKDLAKEYVNKFNTTFSVLVGWLRKNQELALELGYARTALGRKRYFHVPKKPAILSSAHLYRERIIRWEKTPEGKNRPVKEWYADGLNTLNYNPLNPWDENLPKYLKDYYNRIAGIKREGGNSPIQGGNADITKIAMAELRKWIRDYERKHNNGEYLAHVCLQVYDEILMDCPDFMAEEARVAMDEIMRKAGQCVITKVPVETACVVADCWQK